MSSRRGTPEGLYIPKTHPGLDISEAEDKATLEFIREPYDIEAVAAKIIAEPELADWLGERLREGR